MPGTVPGNTSRQDLPSFRNKTAQLVGLFIIDCIYLIYTKRTYSSSTSASFPAHIIYSPTAHAAAYWKQPLPVRAGLTSLPRSP